MFERPKTVRTLDRAAIGTGIINLYGVNYLYRLKFKISKLNLAVKKMVKGSVATVNVFISVLKIYPRKF
jgi:hypothetical protein